MKSNRLLCGGLLACLGLFLGCTARQYEPIKLAVPFVEQHPDDCGAATLSMLFALYGITVPLAEVEQQLFIPALKGTTPELIVDFGLRNGLKLEQGQKDWGFLVENLERGLPAIVLFGPSAGGETGHFVVATGLNRYRNKVRLHDGRLENRWMLRDNFLARWERGHYTVLWPTIPQDLGVSAE